MSTKTMWPMRPMMHKPGTPFDPEKEIERSIRAQINNIASRAHSAIDSLYWMHAIGSGVCYCGSDYENHGWDDTHGATEMPMDKMHAPIEEGDGDEPAVPKAA